MLRLRAAAAFLALALAAGAAAAQGPEADWRTLESEHFRVHFPAAAEAWASRLASRLEAIRLVVAEEVGYLPPQRLEVIVEDPAAAANGSAWPRLDAPRMVLWTTPPAAASALAHASDWSELLAIHETAHLAHLLRPSRRPARRWLERTLLPLGPLPLGAPRWAIEGYATLVEGRISGSGRPGSALGAAILRAWARAGRLPGYARLSHDRERFLGPAMAYWVGARFLAWAEARADSPGALRRVWAATTARSGRDFDAAWTRVFGEAPAASYARFVAEQSAQALAAERERAPDVREGEVWLDLSWETGEPALSHDGGELAAIVRERRRPARLVVWSLAGAEPAAPSRPESPPAADPEDPPAAPRPPRSRPEARELAEPPGMRFESARFLPGGGDLLVVARAPDRRGDLRADLFVWRAGRPLARRTRGADLRAADPHPGGSLAAAVRWRAGGSQLVLVELASGAVRELSPPEIEAVHDAPRFSPAGDELAWLEQRDGRWRVMRAGCDVERGALAAPREVALAAGEPTHLAWRRDGSHLYVAAAAGEEIEIHALPAVAGARLHRVTRSLDAAFAPAPAPDGRWLYYLGLAPDGIDLRRLALDAATAQGLAEPAPAAATAPPAGRELAVRELPPSRPYGLGTAVATPLVAGWLGSDAGPLEAGARWGDAVGRWELLALGAAGDREDRRGGALAASWRGSPLRLSAHAAALREHDGGGEALELAGARDLVLGRATLGGRLALGWARPQAGPTATRVELALGGASAWRRGALTLRPSLAARWTEDLDGGDAAWWRLETGLDLAAGRTRLALAAARGETRAASGAAADWRLGGPPSSLAPSTFAPARLDHPALPDGLLAAPRLDSLSLRLRPAGRPFALVAERHRGRSAAGEREEVELVGIESAWSLPALPLAGLPALELRAGAARMLAGRLEGRTRWWLGLRLPLASGAGDGETRGAR